MSRYTVDDISNLPGDNAIALSDNGVHLMTGKNVGTFGTICDLLNAQDDAVDVARDIVSDAIYLMLGETIVAQHPDGGYYISAATFHALRRKIKAIDPKTEQELLKDRLKAADELALKFRLHNDGDYTAFNKFKSTKAAHEAAKANP